MIRTRWPPNSIVWGSGTEPLRARVEAALGADPDHETAPTRLHTGPHRLALRVSAHGTSGPPLWIKIHGPRPGPRGVRDALERPLGRSRAQREWLALTRLQSAGLPVAEPLGFGRCDREAFVVMRAYPGETLLDVATRDPGQAIAAWLDPLASLLEQLLECGWIHGDLHFGNLLATDAGLRLLDLQRARRSPRGARALTDLARLELSSARAGLPAQWRCALRERLGLAASRTDVALRRRAKDFVRGRSRRLHRDGGAWRAVTVAGLRGMRQVDLEVGELEAALREAITAFQTTPARSPRVQLARVAPRRTPRIVKRSIAGTHGRALADCLRGSEAARGFRRAQRVELLGARVAPCRAWLEELRGGPTRGSWLVMDEVGSIELDTWRPRTANESLRVARALGAWLAESHAWGIHHRDLKGSNLRLDPSAEIPRFWLVDPAELRLGRMPSERERLRALAQLNASLAEESVGAAAREAFLVTYCARLPFRGWSPEALRRRLVRASLDRAHRFGRAGASPASP